jgi:SpoVK/Ycf46/Vps4 family AAA+-type ATPase
VSEGNHQSSYQNLEGYVKGGGKVALLVSRDLTRVTASCISLAKKSNRTLYRWDGRNLEKYAPNRVQTSFSKIWEHITEQRDFEKLFTNFSGTPNAEAQSTGFSVPSSDTPEQEDAQFDANAILWMPLIQPQLMQDGGGTGTRNATLLGHNLLVSKWALSDDETFSNSDDAWNGKTIIFGGLKGELPPELNSVTHVIRWEYPSRLELRDLIFGQTGEYVQGEFILNGYRGNGCGSILDTLGKQRMFASGALSKLASDEYVNDNENFIQKMVQSAQGLDIEDCKVAVLSAFRDALEENKPLMNGEVIERVMNRKVELLSSDGLLSIENTGVHEKIGGYQAIVDEITNLQLRFESSLGEKFGIKPPKGVILTGVPGCGKSLTAKTIADLLKVPLIGFDLGKITTSMYGESEERMHKALNVVTGMAPCVLWIDEFEKMFSSARNDGGGSHEVSQRMNAIFLKWMEERKNRVFVVATSNDLSGIKAEYQRTGRWDGTYFFDLPSSFERYSIIQSILDSYKNDNIGVSISDEQMELIVNQTNGWAGSDINGLLNESKNITFDRWLMNTDQNKDPVLHYATIQDVFDSEKIKPLMEKDVQRLNKIRREGLSYTSASNYLEGDIPVELPENSTEANELSRALLQILGPQRRLE